jgi:glucose-1-phosphate cytidylyltransferase
MKVVLFCGGLGTRLREYSDVIPKPLVRVGYRPIMWHLMRYYAHYGHNEFILCLGHKGDAIKQYFLDYEECLSNDFTLARGGQDIRLHASDISDWTITFVDTGQVASVGERLLAVREQLAGDEMFLANYSDGLSDIHLPSYLAGFQESGRTAAFASVVPSQTFHVVRIDASGAVCSIEPVRRADMWINGGFFAFRNEIFDYIRSGEDLLNGPFQRLIDADQLHTYRHSGFWACMDTFREKQQFDEMFARGETPWAVWDNEDGVPSHPEREREPAYERRDKAEFIFPLRRRSIGRAAI